MLHLLTFGWTRGYPKWRLYFSTFPVAGRSSMFKIQPMEGKWEYCLFFKKHQSYLFCSSSLPPSLSCDLACRGCHFGQDIKATSRTITAEEAKVPDRMGHNTNCEQPAQMFMWARNKCLTCLSHCCFQNLLYILMLDHVDQMPIWWIIWLRFYKYLENEWQRRPETAPGLLREWIVLTDHSGCQGELDNLWGKKILEEADVWGCVHG